MAWVTALRHRLRAPAPTEWTKPPLQTSLERMGGMDAIVRRVELLLEQSI
jgi:hypothetical protein